MLTSSDHRQGDGGAADGVGESHSGTNVGLSARECYLLGGWPEGLFLEVVLRG